MADTQTPELDVKKNNGGRPLKFETDAELKQRIETYYNTCDPHTEMRRVEDGAG